MPWPISEIEKVDLINLGLKIKSIRKEKKLSLEKVACKVGKDRQSLHKLEKGEFNPSYLYLKEICRGLDIELKDLF